MLSGLKIWVWDGHFAYSIYKAVLQKRIHGDAYGHNDMIGIQNDTMKSEYNFYLNHI